MLVYIFNKCYYGFVGSEIMKIYSIDKRLNEKAGGLADENILVALTDEEWGSEAFHNLPHRKKVIEMASHISGVNVQLFPDCILGTLLILQKGNQNGTPLPLSFYFTDKRFYLIGDQNAIQKLISRANKTALPNGTSTKDILGVFINLLIDEDNIFFRGLVTSLEKIEENVIKEPKDMSLSKLNSLRKELRSYKTLYGQLCNISLNLQSNPYNMLSPEQCAEYNHLGIRAELVSEHIKDLNDYALQIKDIYQSQIEMRQTKAMNILTIVSSIFLPLTLITGWYGMNFMHMSELKWAFSYPAVFIISIIIVAIEIWVFWKKDLFK